MSFTPGAAWPGFIAACVGASTANLIAWAGSQAERSTPEQAVAALLGAAVTAAWVWRSVRRNGAGAGALAWDGAVWHWAAPSAQPLAGELRVMIDLGAWMLLRFAPHESGRRAAWLPVSRRQAGPAWSQWRATLFSTRRASEPGAAPDPS